MIAMPPGWHAHYSLDRVWLVHPDGADVAHIEYRERVRPLRKAGALLRDLAAEVPYFTPAALPDCVERVITDEGEYAALATLHGTEHCAEVQRDVGFVFGDDCYARVSARCARADQRSVISELVRVLVRTDVHALGVRRRRFEYAPPRGWQPIVRLFRTDWLAPRYPREQVWVTVYPAIPLPLLRPDMLATMVAGTVANARTLHLANGLVGDVAEAAVSLGDRSVHKLGCVLRDSRYAYAFEATSKHGSFEPHRGELDRIFASVEPIPQPHLRAPAPAAVYSAQSFWVE